MHLRTDAIGRLQLKNQPEAADNKYSVCCRYTNGEVSLSSNEGTTAINQF